jgi:hypothetical protein
MAFSEFVVPTLKTDPETEATFMKELAPFLIEILETHATPPKHKYFGKILVENGNDVSGDFRLVMGLGSSLLLLFPPPFLIDCVVISHFVSLLSHFPHFAAIAISRYVV